jgi:glycerol uptake facilitator-like aquaporin
MANAAYKYLVEFLGTALLVFVIFKTGNFLAIGAALAVAVYLGGKISGGAFNPAVAFALMIDGKVSNMDIIPYVLAELAGAFVAYKLAKAF